MQDGIKRAIEEILDKLSLLVIDIEQNDPKAYAEVHEYFKKIRELKELPEEYVAIIDEAMKKIEDLIFDECSFEEGIEFIAESISELQNLLQAATGNRKPAERSSKKSKSKNVKRDEIVDEDILKQFLQSQPSLLEEFEGKVLDLENGDKEAGKEIRRNLHTWKGEAGVLGLMSLQGFIHNVESLLAENDSAAGEVSIDGLFAVKDFLAQYFKVLESGDIPSFNQEDADKIYSLFNQTDKAESEADVEEKEEKQQESGKPAEPEEEMPQIDLSGDTSLMFDFITESLEHLHNAEVMLMNLETNPGDKESLDAIFRAFHTIKGVSSFVGLQDVTKLSHKAETMLDKARKGEIELSSAHIDISFETVDMLKNIIESVQKAIEGGEYHTPENYSALIIRIEDPEAHNEEIPAVSSHGKKVGEILVESGKVSNYSVERAIESQRKGNDKPIGEILVREGNIKPKEVVKALRSQKTPSKAQKSVKIEQTIKVSTGRLDNLIDMVGELVIANSMVAQESEVKMSKNHRLTRNVSHLVKIVRELQELSMSLRMVSVKSTFQKMARLVRDLAKKNNKLVNFEMSGEDTELDRNVVEEIGDPLIHMVRNAVDHGIEPAEERTAKGKSEYGTVHLNAYHKGGNVVIEISDDGKGLDKDRILEKALKMGVIKESDNLNDHEIYNLIFHAGLSTAKKVTDVSGRGVGMDVVRRNIETLRGHVDIKSNQDQGSTISLMLPLTLAIIDGMIVRVGKEIFIIPTVSVLESFRPSPDQITDVAGRGKIIDLRGRHLPLYNLDRMFSVTNAVQNPCEGLVIVVSGSGNGKLHGFVVDELMGQQQVVIKSIGKGVGQLEGISGGAIMGDGKVGLILDPAGIVRVAESVKAEMN